MMVIYKQASRISAHLSSFCWNLLVTCILLVATATAIDCMASAQGQSSFPILDPLLAWPSLGQVITMTYCSSCALVSKRCEKIAGDTVSVNSQEQVRPLSPFTFSLAAPYIVAVACLLVTLRPLLFIADKHYTLYSIVFFILKPQ